MRALLIAAGLALAAATVLAVAKSDSAEFFPLPSDPATLVMEGTILDGDGARLFATYEAQRIAGHQPYSLLLNSEGGQVYAGETVAKMVRTLGLATGVSGHDTCASMCMLVFAAGRERWFMADASLGVHSILTYPTGGLTASTGTEDEGALAATAWLAREMKHLGTPDGIVTKMITTPGTGMTWLTYEDLTTAGWAISAEDVQAARAAVPDPIATASDDEPKLHWMRQPDDSSCQSRQPEIRTASAERAKRKFCKMHKAAFPERCAAS